MAESLPLQCPIIKTVLFDVWSWPVPIYLLSQTGGHLMLCPIFDGYKNANHSETNRKPIRKARSASDLNRDNDACYSPHGPLPGFLPGLFFSVGNFPTTLRHSKGNNTSCVIHFLKNIPPYSCSRCITCCCMQSLQCCIIKSAFQTLQLLLSPVIFLQNAKHWLEKYMPAVYMITRNCTNSVLITVPSFFFAGSQHLHLRASSSEF
jgi:hypothetical protein